MINTQYISSGGGSPMANVVKKHSISSELAQNMVDEAVAKARESGVRENVAILDDGGNPLLPGPGGGPARRLAPLPEGAEPPPAEAAGRHSPPTRRRSRLYPPRWD